MEATLDRAARIIADMGASAPTRNKLLSTGLAVDAEKEKYRMRTGHSI